MKVAPTTLFAALSLFVGLSFALPQEGLEPGETPPSPDRNRGDTQEVTKKSSPKAQNVVNQTLTKVSELEKQVAALAAEQAALRTTLEGVVRYLDERSKAAANMSKALGDVESAGFTAGINPRSREVLLSSWRDFLAKENVKLPALPAKQPQRESKRRRVERPTANGARWR